MDKHEWSCSQTRIAGWEFTIPLPPLLMKIYLMSVRHKCLQMRCIKSFIHLEFSLFCWHPYSRISKHDLMKCTIWVIWISQKQTQFKMGEKKRCFVLYRMLVSITNTHFSFDLWSCKIISLTFESVSEALHDRLAPGPYFFSLIHWLSFNLSFSVKHYSKL